MSAPISFSSYQTPSKVEALKKMGWCSLGFSLGTTVLLTIGLLSQFHVLHHVGNVKLTPPMNLKWMTAYAAMNLGVIALSTYSLNQLYKKSSVIKPQEILVKDKDGKRYPLSFYGILGRDETLKSLQKPFLKGSIDQAKIFKAIQGFNGTIAIQYREKLYINHGERVGMYSKNSFALGTSKGVTTIDLQYSTRLVLTSFDLFDDPEYFEEIMRYSHEYFDQKIQDVEQLKKLALIRLQRSIESETAITTIDLAI